MSGGNGVIFRFDPSGQEDIRGAASENTERTPRGVSNAEGMAADFERVRIRVW